MPLTPEGKALRELLRNLSLVDEFAAPVEEASIALVVQECLATCGEVPTLTKETLVGGGTEGSLSYTLLPTIFYLQVLRSFTGRPLSCQQVFSWANFPYPDEEFHEAHRDAISLLATTLKKALPGGESLPLWQTMGAGLEWLDGGDDEAVRSLPYWQRLAQETLVVMVPYLGATALLIERACSLWEEGFLSPEGLVNLHHLLTEDVQKALADDEVFASRVFTEMASSRDLAFLIFFFLLHGAPPEAFEERLTFLLRLVTHPVEGLTLRALQRYLQDPASYEGMPPSWWAPLLAGSLRDPLSPPLAGAPPSAAPAPAPLHP